MTHCTDTMSNSSCIYGVWIQPWLIAVALWVTVITDYGEGHLGLFLQLQPEDSWQWHYISSYYYGAGLVTLSAARAVTHCTGTMNNSLCGYGLGLVVLPCLLASSGKKNINRDSHYIRNNNCCYRKYFSFFSPHFRSSAYSNICCSFIHSMVRKIGIKDFRDMYTQGIFRKCYKMLLNLLHG